MTAEETVDILGVFFAAYKADGSAIVWNPPYYRKSDFAAAIMQIVKSGLESAPVEERKIIAAATLEKVKWIGLGCDDHDLSCSYFGFNREGVTAGHNSYKQMGVEAAIQKTISELVKFLDGVANE